MKKEYTQPATEAAKMQMIFMQMQATSGDQNDAQAPARRALEK